MTSEKHKNVKTALNRLQEGHLVWELEQEMFHIYWERVLADSNFAILHIFTNDVEKFMSTDFQVTNKF